MKADVDAQVAAQTKVVADDTALAVDPTDNACMQPTTRIAWLRSAGPISSVTILACRRCPADLDRLRPDHEQVAADVEEFARRAHGACTALATLVTGISGRTICTRISHRRWRFIDGGLNFDQRSIASGDRARQR